MTGVLRADKRGVVHWALPYGGWGFHQTPPQTPALCESFQDGELIMTNGVALEDAVPTCLACVARFGPWKGRAGMHVKDD